MQFRRALLLLCVGGMLLLVMLPAFCDELEVANDYQAVVSALGVLLEEFIQR